MFEIILIIIAIAPEGILEAMLIPLFPYIASSFNSDNGIDSGLLTSAFFMPLFLMNIIWGMVSDAYGRKHVLLAGLAIGLVSALIVGEAETFTVVFLGRLLAGFFGSNSTVAKSMIGDISTSSKELAWAYSTYGAVYGLSGILGPMLAGILYDPAKLYPNTFSKYGFFGSKPLRLVCYFGAGLTFASLIITAFCLKEKKKIKRSDSDSLFEEEVPLETAPQMDAADDEDLAGYEQKTTSSVVGSKKRYTAVSGVNDFRTSKTRSTEKRGSKYFAFIRQSPLYKAKVIFAISLYIVIAAAQMVYSTSIPLFFQSTKYGISLSAQETSLLLMVIAMVKFPLQVYGFQKLIIYFKNLESCFCVYNFTNILDWYDFIIACKSNISAVKTLWIDRSNIILWRYYCIPNDSYWCCRSFLLH
jgi:MFS family permease